MEKKNGLLIGLIACAIALSVITLLAVAYNKVDEQALTNKIAAKVLAEIPEVKVPTAEDIAKLVKVETPVIPEFESDSKVEDLWNDLYATQIEELETEAYNVAVKELEKKDYKTLEQWLENIENFDELKDVSNYDLEDCKLNVVELGLEDDSDKIATVECDLKVKYSLLEGPTNNFKKIINWIATVTFDEGDFSDENVEIVFA